MWLVVWGSLVFSAWSFATDTGPWYRRLFLAKPQALYGLVKVAYFDLDGTLRISRGGGERVRDENDILILPGVAKRLKESADLGYLNAIVSNHAWVPKEISYEQAAFLIYRTIQMLQEKGATVHYYDYAADDSASLKPRTGMSATLEQRLMEEYGYTVDFNASLMVGDNGFGQNLSDSGFARSLGIPYHHAETYFGWPCSAKLLAKSMLP